MWKTLMSRYHYNNDNNNNNNKTARDGGKEEAKKKLTENEYIKLITLKRSKMI